MSITNIYGNSSTPSSTIQVLESFSSKNDSDKSLLDGISLKKIDPILERLYYRIVNANIFKQDKRLLITTLRGAVLDTKNPKARVQFVQLFEELIYLKESQYRKPKDTLKSEKDKDTATNPITENIKNLGFDEETKSNIISFISSKKDEYIPSTQISSLKTDTKKDFYD